MNWAEILRLINECLSALLHRGYDLYVLLNLLKKFGKSDKCEACPFLSLFRIRKFIKFNTTRAQMVDPIYHMTFTIRLLLNLISDVKNTIV